eukprot:SAG31_NODE_7421_length_1693_cov_1.616060_1_plen_136_part_00
MEIGLVGIVKRKWEMILENIHHQLNSLNLRNKNNSKNNKNKLLVRCADLMRNALSFNLKTREMAKIEIEVTKIQKILIERGLTQTDLYELIKDGGNEIGKDRINRIVNGKLTNFHTNTAKILANALGVKIDDVVE